LYQLPNNSGASFRNFIKKNKMVVKVINHSNNALPAYETALSAGMDVRASLNETITIKPFERKLIPTGLFLEIEPGYECQVRPRSGLALKKGITVLNSPGTIDADYRGEVGVVLVNVSNEDVHIETGERIAQLVFAPVIQAKWEIATEISTTERGSGGFGSTGTN
jgi:dUTP pyrophosphatase